MFIFALLLLLFPHIFCLKILLIKLMTTGTNTLVNNTLTRSAEELSSTPVVPVRLTSFN